MVGACDRKPRTSVRFKRLALVCLDRGDQALKYARLQLSRKHVHIGADIPAISGPPRMRRRADCAQRAAPIVETSRAVRADEPTGPSLPICIHRRWAGPQRSDGTPNSQPWRTAHIDRPPEDVPSHKVDRTRKWLAKPIK